MAYQAVFRRYELKFLLTASQKAAVFAAMQPYMAPDKYGRTTIRNIYFDTETYRLIRHSIEKPAYKEKLRLRSYEKVTGNSPVYVELKKKYKSIVYKRRIAMAKDQALGWICGRKPYRPDSQIGREIDYFIRFYGTLRPTVFLSYEREAYYSRDGSDFRVTFDDTILCQQEDIRFETDLPGIPILPPDMTLMEIKCSGGVPLWMTRVLSENRIYKTSFSKYGTAYQTLIFPKPTKEVTTNA